MCTGPAKQNQGLASPHAELQAQGPHSQVQLKKRPALLYHRAGKAQRPRAELKQKSWAHGCGWRPQVKLVRAIKTYQCTQHPNTFTIFLKDFLHVVLSVASASSSRHYQNSGQEFIALFFSWNKVYVLDFLGIINL